MIKVENSGGISYIIPEHELKKYMNMGYKKVEEKKPKKLKKNEE